MKRLIIALGIIAFATTQQSRAQSANTDTATLHFITKVSIANLQEVATSRIAVQKSSRQDVKEFGGRMIADHSDAQNKLLALAKAGGYSIPMNATATPVDDPLLKNAPEKDFDHLYVHMMVVDHREAVGRFQNYAISGKDRQIKAFVQQTLPVLKQHLDMINAIDGKIKYDTAK